MRHRGVAEAALKFQRSYGIQSSYGNKSCYGNSGFETFCRTFRTAHQISDLDSLAFFRTMRTMRTMGFVEELPPTGVGNRHIAVSHCGAT